MMKRLLLAATTGLVAFAPTAAHAATEPRINVPLSAYHADGVCHGKVNGHRYDDIALSYYPEASYATFTSARITNIHMQAALCTRGYKLTIDGVNGAITQGALRDFQRKNHLTADGLFGPATGAKFYGTHPFSWGKAVNTLAISSIW